MVAVDNVLRVQTAGVIRLGEGDPEVCLRLGRGGGVGIEAAHIVLVPQRLRAEPLDEIQRRLARLAVLGGDDDEAVGPGRPINGARRRTFEHLDAVDVSRVEVGDAVHLLVLARGDAATRSAYRVQAVRVGVVVDDDAVDDIERLVRAIDSIAAANLHLNAATRRAPVLRDHGARDLALQRVLDGRLRNAVQFRASHNGDRVCHVAGRYGRSLTGDVDLLEMEHVRLAGEIRRGSDPGKGFDRTAEADTAGAAAPARR